MSRRLPMAVAILLLPTAASLWGCADGGGAQGAVPQEVVTPAQPDPGALRTVAGEPVQGRTGPGGEPFEIALRTQEDGRSVARRIGTKTFDIGLRVRTPELRQYPCTSCHLGAPQVLAAERVADAHQNIQPVHPAETDASCSNCHSAANVELLVLHGGETVTLDHAYRLCAQCHFAQVDAWAGGAHGKRLDGWRGRRVVMGCAECHDPHRPGIESRIPIRPPIIHQSGRREH